ncbi:glycosyltransferase family 4 protein [Pedobacter jeongneungensis]|uniref:Glycosyltransferase family 4 protein n=1 Tax=Pedobacter jeongneungensis TaxID=947309 RepID=A0ABP8BEL5_9SPHI
MMKILHTVESYLPSRHGMQEVVTQLSEALVKMGHDVSIATSYNEHRKVEVINGVKIVAFKIEGNYSTGIKGDVSEYQNYLLASNFDIITNFAAQQWATDLMLPIMDQMKGKKIFVPTGFSALNQPIYREYFTKMKLWMKGYDDNVFLSDNYRDINFAKENNITSIKIIPNGASEKEFSETNFINVRELIGVPDETTLILSVGSHTGYKGHDKSIEIFQKAKIPNSALLIIGNVTTSGGKFKSILKGYLNLLGLKRTNCSLSCRTKARLHNSKKLNNSIHIREFPRSVTVNAYKQADLFMLTSLIECSPIVLFEALAGETPFLVNDVGNAKEIINWTRGGKLLPTTFDDNGFSIVDIDSSADILRDLVKDTNQMEKYAYDGHTAFLNGFTWEKIALKYERLYFSHVNKLN